MQATLCRSYSRSTWECPSSTGHAEDPGARWKAGQQRLEDIYNINMTGIEYVADCIESHHNGNYFMSYDSYSNFATSLPSGASNYSQLIGAKVSSMKTIYSVFRDQHMLNTLRGSQVTSRLNPFSTMVPRPEMVTSNRDLSDTQYKEGTGWYFAIGATHYPPTPVRSDPESYYEGCMARHNLQMRHSTGLVVPKEYRISARVDNRVGTVSQNNGSTDLSLAPENWYHSTLRGGSFFLGVNFESQAHRSDYSNSGVSTLAQNLYLMCMFPNSRNDFDENVYINTGVLSPNSAAGNKNGLDEQVAAFADFSEKMNRTQFPGAVVPVSATKTQASDDAFAAWALKDNLYGNNNSIDFANVWQGPYAYQAQQGAMIVDHWVQYDGFMVVEMGEVKTRW